MIFIEARNVNDALQKGINVLLTQGTEEDSRNGKVLVAPHPVVTTYHRPKERVLFNHVRDANPFFHLMESFWMLEGRKDLELPQTFNSKFGAYSDDGKTVWGAYGWRWRKFFGYDQIELIINELRKNPNSRRCVLSMWNAEADGGDLIMEHSDLYVGFNGGKDVPCNTHAYFDVRGGRLNMTVCNRSNDAIWGAYGANAVHFSVLQEEMAVQIGVDVGVYRQVSNNFHVYLNIYDRAKLQNIASINEDMYVVEGLNSASVTEASRMLEPLRRVWTLHKAKKTKEALDIIKHDLPLCDWQVATYQWLERRLKNANSK